MSIWQWARWLPSVPAQAQITLGEGNTPLVRSKRLGPELGLTELWFKLESASPTGSYKDRFAAALVADMLAHQKRRCLATSSGNTGSALAAYCAAAGLACKIAIVETAPEGKLKQMLAYGAQLYRVRGFGTDAAVTQRVMDHLKQQAQQPDATLAISAFHYSPQGMVGVQTLSYELAQQMDGKIDHVFCPAGGGGLTLAVAKGFEVLSREGRLSRPVKVHCVQPEGNDTIATPLHQGAAEARAVACTSQISGLQVANVIDGHEVIRACRACGGDGHTVSDEEVWAMQQRLARQEGIFCEPAGAVATAAVYKAAQAGRLAPDARIVCLVTGSGFKDPLSIDRMTADASCPLIEVDDLAP
ncbi:MAG TPA: pyridoxal-phosphate dependent enzyme [Phycisphaeraceae bacterium]